MTRGHPSATEIEPTGGIEVGSLNISEIRAEGQLILATEEAALVFNLEPDHSGILNTGSALLQENLSGSS